MNSAELLIKSSQDARAVRSSVARALRPYDLTPTQWSVLGLVASKPGLRVTDVARRVGATVASSSILLKYLKSRKLVGVKYDEDLRRRNYHFVGKADWLKEVEGAVQNNLKGEA